MAELKKLKSQRAQLKSQLTRFKNFVERSHNEESLSELSVRLESTVVTLNEFNKVQINIEQLEEDSEEREEVRIEFESNYFSTIAKAKRLLASTPTIRTDSPIVSEHEPRSSCKLPELKIPEFHGQFSEWTQFRDTFDALIDKNLSISNIQKLYYLQASLKGEARNAIASLNITAASYEIAWANLKKRYDNKKAIIHSHLKQIFELPHISKESHLQLRPFLDTFTKHYFSLLNQNNLTLDAIITYLLVSKFDSQTRMKWETNIKNIDDPKVDDIIEFLSVQCRLLETVKLHETKTTQPVNTNRTYAHVSSQVFDKRDVKCPLCSEAHFIYHCTKFLNMTVSERYDEVKRLQLCTNCLRRGHSRLQCLSGRCRRCNGQHSSLLHRDSSVSVNQITNLSQNSSLAVQPSTSGINNQITPNSEGIAQEHTIAVHASAANSLVLLSTAIIHIYDKNNTPIRARALLDGCSQSNFLTKDLFEKLHLSSESINFAVSGLGSVLSANVSARTKANIKSLNSEFQTKEDFLVIDTITDNIPQFALNLNRKSFPNVAIADPYFDKPGRIDILLGAGIFYNLLEPDQIKIPNENLLLQNTKLGWLVTGTLHNIQFKTSHSQKSFCSLTTDESLLEQLRRFWETEEPYLQRTYSKEEVDCEKHFTKNFKRDHTGAFVVRLPLKDNYTALGDSYQSALRQFHSLERRLNRNPELKLEYSRFIQEFMSLDHAEEVDPSAPTPSNPYYLAHHCVEKDASTTTRLRVVFNGSGKSTTGLSLNDVLKVGPTIQPDLFCTIINFRIPAYVITADISKMYRMVKVATDEQYLQRILWRNHPQENVKHFNLKTVTYGLSSSAFLSTRCLKQLALENERSFPLESRIISENFYIDDLLFGLDDPLLLNRTRKNLETILSSAGFVLRKFMSNKPDLLTDLANDNNISQYVITDSQSTKTLGIAWNANVDNFEYTSHLVAEPMLKITKRKILSVISQVFDPLGLLGPILIQGKILLQKLWLSGVAWDAEVPSNIKTLWLDFFNQLHRANTIYIPRHCLLTNRNRVFLIGFCDSSEAAFGATIYLRSINETTVLTRLLCAKSRVAPLKVISLPKLELCGAVLLARLAKKVLNDLRLEINGVYYFTDSTIVLSWLSAEASTWKTFVANRIGEIQRLTPVTSWYHVKSENNPADIISRGTNANDLNNSSLWWNGPPFLSQDPEFWDVSPISNFCRSASTPESKNKIVSMPTFQNIDLIDRYSSLLKLQRITAYCLRFYKNSKVPARDRNLGPLAVEEMDNALIVLVKAVQESVFSSDLRKLRSKGSVSSNSSLKSLNPFLDEDGCIRVGGRLDNSNLSFSHKHPILIPSRHHFSELVVRYEHLRNLHCGIQTTLSIVRQRFWPLNGRSLVRRIVHKCIPCFKAKPRTHFPQMGNLPAQRVRPSRVFMHTGIDYLGPFQLKDGKYRNRKILKSYICLFICMCTRAVHLELVTEATTDCFLAALKRFVARRGLCRDIYSDNATNFVGANNDIQEATKLLSESSFQEYLLESSIKWHFIPPRSPHFGGYWEVNVGSVKNHLKRMLTNNPLTYEEFTTLITSIEAVLNSRPICPLSSDPNDLQAISPSHFILGESLTAVPERNVTMNKVSHTARYLYVQQMAQHFWNRWSVDFLHNLQQRTKWFFRKNPSELLGALCILKEDNRPSCYWPLGRIVRIVPGRDDIIRVVEVKTKNGSFKRALARVCLLPTEDQIC